MFHNLTNRLLKTFRNIGNCGRLTEENIKETLREVRIALLEADVALPVVHKFINHVKERAVGNKINKNLSPGQELIKIVHSELIEVMGSKSYSLNLNLQSPSVILITGLQGAGKTTSVGKLSKLLHEKFKKKILVVSTDVYRPAAIQQLKTIVQKISVDFYPSNSSQNPIDIVSYALKEAKLKFYDLLLVDTAGRLHIDQIMMNEIKQIYTAVNPIETLFVVDAMTGQDAANTAKFFNREIPLTGIILTKTDGDARGGAALSIRYITGKPIKFIGTGEKINELEPFYPDRLASRIVGMDDVLSLIEEIENKVDRVQAKRITNKLKKGENFNLNDFLEQLKQIRSIGSMNNLIDKIPSLVRTFDNKKFQNIKLQIDEKVFICIEAMINSMTYSERETPDIIKGSRKRRIAAGSGMQIQDINRMLKQFYDAQRIMKKMQNGGMLKIIRGMKGILPSNFYR